MKRYSQLGREGQEKKDHRYRPHALIEARQPQVQQRIPHRHPQGRPWPHRRIRLNDDYALRRNEDGVDQRVKKTKKAPLLALLVVDWGGYGYRIQRSFPYFLSGIRAMNFSFCTK